MEITTENYFELKNQKVLRADIATQFGLTEGQLKKLITKNGWAKPAPKTLNETAFSQYTEESCYWAGFLAADGNVDNKNRIRIMLNYDDTNHLEKFKEYLKSTYTISSNTDKYYRSSFEFTHKQMREDLEKNFLIIPNKTDRLELPNSIPNNLLKHYIRGYFDGDGCICESFSNKASVTASLYATFCSGSTNFAKDLYNTLEFILGLKGNLQEYPGKWVLKYNVNDAKVLLDWMYKDSIVYLDRKYQLYIKTVVDNNRKTR